MLHGKLRCSFINVVDHCLLKLHRLVVNADVYPSIVVKDGLTFYLKQIGKETC